MLYVLMLLALGGGLLTAAQALLIVLQGNILCLNDGCEIVEKLTTVPPIAFNVSGSLYFMTIFLALWQGARGVRGWLGLARVFILAGMAAEGVLIGFQYYVAEVFCSYCLIIFSIVIALNILMGLKQIVSAAAVFGAVLIAFSSLHFTSQSEANGAGLEKGTYGRLEKRQSGDTLYLFFSSTCLYCEEVIETIDSNFTCNLNFNPIDNLKVSPLPELAVNPEYSPAINRSFLKHLDLSEIPVLTVKGDGEVRILKGKQLIREYLDNHCRTDNMSTTTPSGSTGISEQRNGLPYFSAVPEADACSVDEDCEEPPARSGVQ